MRGCWHRFWLWTWGDDWAFSDRPSEPHRPGCVFVEQKREVPGGTYSPPCNCGRTLAYYKHWWSRPMLWLVNSRTFRRLVFCRWFWHAPENDHCGKPEHRFCIRCNKPTPFAEVGA